MILTGLWMFPLLGAGLLLLIPSQRHKTLHALALLVALAYLLLTLLPWPQVWAQSSGWAYQLVCPWIPSVGVSYGLALDGLSYALILLNSFVALLVIWISPLWIKQNVKSYYVYLFLLSATVVGALLATDLILFYIFWEAMLIPMAFLIGIFGSERRMQAAMKFFLYTMLGGLTMLVAIIGTAYVLRAETGYLSFAYEHFLRFGTSGHHWAPLFFGLMSLAFFIKIPLFPFYTWLPDAHTEAPAGGSVILAAVLLKLGVYGLLRFLLPFYTSIYLSSSFLWAMLGVVGIIWGGFLAWSQNDLKRLIACSSVSHMGFIVLGLFSGSLLALRGSLFQMLAHGLSTGALFFMVGMMYARTHTRRMDDYGGLAKLAPEFSFFFIYFCMASAGLPGLAGFVGEFLILLGSFERYPWLTVAASLGVLLAAIYLLMLVQRVFFGPPKTELHFAELSGRERVVTWSLAILILLLGVYPKPALMIFEASLKQAQIYLLPQSLASPHHAQAGCGTDSV